MSAEPFNVQKARDIFADFIERAEYVEEVARGMANEIAELRIERDHLRDEVQALRIALARAHGIE